MSRSVLISFITKFTNKGIKAATKDLNGMEKLTKRFSLGTKAAFAAAATAATVFAEKLVRTSIKAIIDEQKEVATLSKTLSNLGKASDIPEVLNFAENLQRASGVSESVLRPALGSLIQTLGDTSAAQGLLRQALDVSKGSGKDLSQVVGALEKAFKGNLTPLGKMIPSLDRAAIKSGDLSKVMGQLTTQFGGQAAVAADTMQGSLDRLKISASEAAERLGKGMQDALAILGTDGVSQMGNLGKAMEVAADRTSILLAGLASVGKELSGKFKQYYDSLNKQTDGLIGRVVKWGFETSIVGRAYNYLTKKGNEALAVEAKIAAEKAAQTKSVFTYSLFLNDAEQKIVDQLALQSAIAEAERKAAAARKKAAKEAAIALAKQRAEEAKAKKEKAIRDALANKFDLELINLNAAAKAAQTKEEKARVEALIALKTDSYKDDESSLKKLTDLDDARNKALEDQAAKVKAVAAEDAVRAKAMDDFVKKFKETEIKIPVYYTQTGMEIPGAPGVGMGAAGAAGAAGAKKKSTAPVIIMNTAPSSAAFDAIDMAKENIRSQLERVSIEAVAKLGVEAGLGQISQQLSMIEMAGQPVVQDVYVTVQGSVLTQQELISAITDGLYQQQRAGTPISLMLAGR